MTDPYSGISDPQTDRILEEMEYRNGSKRGENYSTIMRDRNKKEEKRELGVYLMLAGLDSQNIPPRHEKAFKVWLEIKDLSKPELQREKKLAEFEFYEMVVALAISCGNRLRLNTMSGQVEFKSQTYNDNVVIENNKPLNILAERNWQCNKLPTSDAVLEYATAYKYSPVVEYLLGLPKIEENYADQILEELCSGCLKQTEPLQKQMIVKTLIGAVTRALEPGSQLQTVLTLQGNQGAGKSEFFAALFGKDFFGHLNSQGDKRDWSMCLGQTWAAELGELEAFTSKHSAGILKAFISEGEDLYRAPYDQTSKKHPRHSILVATVNTHCPLVDPTGNRRWWVLQSPREINVKWVRENRDTIWAAALLKYHAGEAHWFSGEEEQAAMALAEEYCAADPWQELLGEFLECLQNPEVKPLQEQVREMLVRSSHIVSRVANRKGPNCLTTNELLEILLINHDKKNKALSTRLGGIMRLLGYTSKQCRVGKTTIRIWEQNPD